jgi:insertion element IS1 protein InsB
VGICPKKRKKKWIWLCISKITKKVLAVYIGDRSKKSAKELISQVPNMKRYYTDNWDSYNYAIDPSKRVISKKHTQIIERFNLLMRTSLARLQRKAVKFSKSLKQLIYSVNFILNRYNHQLSLEA